MSPLSQPHRTWTATGPEYYCMIIQHDKVISGCQLDRGSIPDESSCDICYHESQPTLALMTHSDRIDHQSQEVHIWLLLCCVLKIDRIFQKCHVYWYVSMFSWRSQNIKFKFSLKVIHVYLVVCFITVSCCFVKLNGQLWCVTALSMYSVSKCTVYCFVLFCFHSHFPGLFHC